MSAVACSLPDNPSLDGLRAEVGRLLRGTGVSLGDAQSSVARTYGFTGWPALEQYLDAVLDLGVDPSGVDEDALEPPDLFCARAALRYDDRDAPPRWRAAADLLGEDPTIVDRHVWAAATATDPAALGRHLSAAPSLADARGGPFGWTPLMYLAYSRVPVEFGEDETLACATLLLDAGADPDAGYLWRGMSTPFTVLTGVFGEGEQGARRQPRHRHATALADLLLRRGAHPADQQALYDRMFRPDDSHLELLFAHGLADAGPSPWERRLGEAMETRAQMWRRQIRWAAEHGFADRLALLARHGIDVSGVDLVPPRSDDLDARDEDGATPLHHAAWDGDLDRIRDLLDAGADPSIADTRFGATPLAWAEHAWQTEAADLLRGQPPT